MSDREFAFDHTKHVLEGLAHYRTAAEQGHGHTMESWQFEDSNMGHVMSSRCSRCDCSVRIAIGHGFDLTKFPASAYAAASGAFTSMCRQPVVMHLEDETAS